MNFEFFLLLYDQVVQVLLPLHFCCDCSLLFHKLVLCKVNCNSIVVESGVYYSLVT
jgi:hypothetical protein